MLTLLAMKHPRNVRALLLATEVDEQSVRLVLRFLVPGQSPKDAELGIENKRHESEILELIETMRANFSAHGFHDEKETYAV